MVRGCTPKNTLLPEIPPSRIGSRVRISASFQRIPPRRGWLRSGPHFMGRFRSEVRVSASF